MGPTATGMNCGGSLTGDGRPAAAAIEMADRQQVAQ
jgi:hypothetical protein